MSRDHANETRAGADDGAVVPSLLVASRGAGKPEPALAAYGIILSARPENVPMLQWRAAVEKLATDVFFVSSSTRAAPTMPLLAFRDWSPTEKCDSHPPAAEQRSAWGLGRKCGPQTEDSINFARGLSSWLSWQDTARDAEMANLHNVRERAVMKPASAWSTLACGGKLLSPASCCDMARSNIVGNEMLIMLWRCLSIDDQAWRSDAIPSRRIVNHPSEYLHSIVGMFGKIRKWNCYGPCNLTSLIDISRRHYPSASYWNAAFENKLFSDFFSTGFFEELACRFRALSFRESESTVAQAVFSAARPPLRTLLGVTPMRKPNPRGAGLSSFASDEASTAHHRAGKRLKRSEAECVHGVEGATTGPPSACSLAGPPTEPPICDGAVAPSDATSAAADNMSGRRSGHDRNRKRDISAMTILELFRGPQQTDPMMRRSFSDNIAELLREQEAARSQWRRDTELPKRSLRDLYNSGGKYFH